MGALLPEHRRYHIRSRWDSERIQDVRNELHKLMNEDQLKDAALLVFANKQDLPKAMNLNELTEKLNLN